MQRRCRCMWALCLVLTAGPLSSERPLAAPPDRPNILWLTAEDLSPNLGAYGDSYARTPHLDRLAREGIRFTRAFATAPVCSPARSCLITGLYATSLGTMHLRSRFPIPSFVKGFPSLLRAAGYYTTNNVKTDYNTSDEPRLIRESWDESSAKAHWRNRNPGQPFFSVFNDMTTHQSRTMVWPYDQFVKEVQSELDPVERHDPDKAVVPPYYPDTPIVRRTLARYHDCTTVLDKHVGALLHALEEDGLTESTIVFFFGDHGAGLPRHKRLVLDSGSHVPLIVRFPKELQHLASVPPGSSVGRLVSFVDFPPTVLSLANVPASSTFQGRAFLGPMAAATPPRNFVFVARDRVDEAYDLARAARDERFLYVRNFRPHVSYNQPSYFSDQGEIREEITRLAREGRLQPGPQMHYAGPTRALDELYDTETDPLQLHNLAGYPEHAETLERLRSQLRAWILETRDVGFLPETDATRRSAGTTPREMATDEARYPLERILDAAELVGQGPSVLSRQVRLLADPDPAVRAWAALGLEAQGWTAASATDALQKALEDPAPSVRIRAAAALCGLGRKAKALKVLERDLRGDDLDAALDAARALELIGETARPALPAMRAVLERVSSEPGDPAMFLRFALEPAVEALGVESSR